MQIASEGLKGRVFEVSLADLQKVGFGISTFSRRARCCISDAFLTVVALEWQVLYVADAKLESASHVNCAPDLQHHFRAFLKVLHATAE